MKRRWPIGLDRLEVDCVRSGFRRGLCRTPVQWRSGVPAVGNIRFKVVNHFHLYTPFGGFGSKSLVSVSSVGTHGTTETGWSRGSDGRVPIPDLVERWLVASRFSNWDEPRCIYGAGMFNSSSGLPPSLLSAYQQSNPNLWECLSLGL